MPFELSPPRSPEECPVSLLEEGQHRRHARLKLGQKARRVEAKPEQKLLHRLDVEHGFGQRFWAAAGMPAIRQDLRIALRLQHGETGLEDLAAVVGHSPAETKRDSDAEAADRIGFLRARELQMAQLAPDRLHDGGARVAFERREHPRTDTKPVDQPVRSDRQAPGKVLPFSMSLSPRNDQSARADSPAGQGSQDRAASGNDGYGP